MPQPFEQHFWFPSHSRSSLQFCTHGPMLLTERRGHSPGLVVGKGADVVVVVGTATKVLKSEVKEVYIM